MVFTLDEVRRLTGPNLLSDEPGAIADVLFCGIEPKEVLSCWQAQLSRCQQAINWQHGQQCYARFYEGGMSLSIPAPMDLLYSACELLELAWDLTVEALSEQKNESSHDTEDLFVARIEALQLAIKEEQHPQLLALMQRAQNENVLCLADDDEVSLGTGPTSRTWPVSALPALDSIDWSAYKEVPLALITGTNGKSTSVRLAAEIAKAAGINAGVTSTDFIKVGDTIIDEGDYSGPGGARMLLRDNRTEMAFLEVARGGLLRRGLPVKQAQAALVTNVAADHLGQYGINTLDDIANVKTMVAKAIAPVRSGDNLSEQSSAQQMADDNQRMLVLNADDTRLAMQADMLTMPICWFSTDVKHPLIQRAIASDSPCVFAASGALVYMHKIQTELAQISDVPMTINGTATHNVQNALGVIGLCKAMGIGDKAISIGLKSFSSSAKDNPGRGNLYDVAGVQVIVDFAHNSHSMQAVIDMAAKISAKRKHVMFSHGGDRSDQDIIDVTDAVLALAPSTYVLAEIERYLRGREMGEISAMVQAHLIKNGVLNERILLANDPLQGTKQIMTSAKAGDLVLLFVLNDRENVQDYLLSIN